MYSSKSKEVQQSKAYYIRLGFNNLPDSFQNAVGTRGVAVLHACRTGLAKLKIIQISFSYKYAITKLTNNSQHNLVALCVFVEVFYDSNYTTLF